MSSFSQENGVVSRQLLQRARALDTRNKKTEKEARKLLNKIAKDNLQEMSILNDHILAEGVENLESESGRTRFFENIQKRGLKCSRATLDATLDGIHEDQGSKAGEATLAAEVWSSDDPAVVALVNIWDETGAVEAGESMTAHCLNAMKISGEEKPGIPYYKELNKASSDAELPGLLINMVAAVDRDLENEGRTAMPRHDLQEEQLQDKRAEIQERCLNLFTKSEKSLAVGRVTRSSAKGKEKVEEDKVETPTTKSSKTGNTQDRPTRKARTPAKVKKLARILAEGMAAEMLKHQKGKSGIQGKEQLANPE